MRVVGAEPDEVESALPADYWRACRLVEQGLHDVARRLYGEMEEIVGEADARLQGLIRNDLGVLDALEGRFDEARESWRQAMGVDTGCRVAGLNDVLISAEMERLVLPQGDVLTPLELAPAPGASVSSAISESARTERQPPEYHAVALTESRHAVRVAVVSFLFNWPSTGGGNMHTAGLAQFLGRAGYEVRHLFARFPDWGIGRVGEDLLSPAEVIEFDAAGWNVGEIQARYRRAVDRFDPDYVIITDTWNMKPLLAEAMRGYPYFLLIQAQENLCPLNNLRLLATGPQQVEQCPRNQFATPEVCHRCLVNRGHHAGALHQVERTLSGVGTPEYDQKLRRSLREAEAVLALNPITAAMLEPFSSRVRVVPWGIDPERFSWAAPSEGSPSSGPSGHLLSEGAKGIDLSSVPSGHLSSHGGKAVLFMAAVVGEFIKGYHVAHEACRLLRQTRVELRAGRHLRPAGAGADR